MSFSGRVQTVLRNHFRRAGSLLKGSRENFSGPCHMLYHTRHMSLDHTALVKGLGKKPAILSNVIDFLIGLFDFTTPIEGFDQVRRLKVRKLILFDTEVMLDELNLSWTSIIGCHGQKPSRMKRIVRRLVLMAADLFKRFVFWITILPPKLSRDEIREELIQGMGLDRNSVSRILTVLKKGIHCLIDSLLCINGAFEGRGHHVVGNPCKIFPVNHVRRTRTEILLSDFVKGRNDGGGE